MRLLLRKDWACFHDMSCVRLEYDGEAERLFCRFYVCTHGVLCRASHCSKSIVSVQTPHGTETTGHTVGTWCRHTWGCIFAGFLALVLKELFDSPGSRDSCIADTGRCYTAGWWGFCSSYSCVGSIRFFISVIPDFR